MLDHERAPGSPEWSARSDVVARAMRLIADGEVDRGGVGAVCARLGYSERQLHRVLVAELGAGAVALARAQRAQTARLLLETTTLAVTDVAFAAGFASVRQFNDTIRTVFEVTPATLRSAGTRSVGTARRPPAFAAGDSGGDATDQTRDARLPGAGGGAITLRLAYRAPLAAAELFGFLAARAVPGIEAGDAHSYRRSLALPHGTGTIDLERQHDHIRARLRLDSLRDLAAAVQRARRLLDLDADPEAVDAQLGDDPLLRPLVSGCPGLRAPGHVDPTELAVRAVLGQQVSVAGARTVAGWLVATYGDRLAAPRDGLTHLFPTPDRLGAADPDALPMPRARAGAMVRLARAVALGEIVLDPGTDPDEASARLLALPGVGPWTAGYVRLRGLGDPDVFLPTDLGVRRAISALVAAAGVSSASAIDPDRWRPWRSYALHHLWRSWVSHPPANRPTKWTHEST